MSTHTATDTAEFLSYLRGLRRADNTIKAYRCALTQYHAHLQRRRKCARTATFADVTTFIASFDDCRPKTAALKLAAIRAFHTWLRASGRRDDDPTLLCGSVSVPADSTRHAHPREQIERVRAQLTIREHRCAFALLADCALRVSSAASVRAEHVDPVTWRLSVVVKGGDRRSVPIAGDTARRDILTQLYAVGGTGWLLPSPDNRERYVHSATVYRWTVDAAQRAGLDPREWTPHWLRHSRGDELRRDGHDAFTIQRFLTHRTIGSTSAYMHPDLDAIDAPAAAPAEDLLGALQTIISGLADTPAGISPLPAGLRLPFILKA